MGETPWLTPKPWKFTASNIPDLSGQTILITGANSGLGYWTSLLLAEKGAEVVLACRDLGRCQDAVDTITKGIRERKSQIHPNLVPMELNLASFASIRKFATDFKIKYPKLDSLILNAGVMFQPFQLTHDNLELTMGTNHFGHFLLALELIETLVQNDKISTISVHSSAAIFEYESNEEAFTPEHLKVLDASLRDSKTPDGSLTTPDWFDTMQCYRSSKLANVMFAQELSKKLEEKGLGEKVLVNAHAPGAVRTGLARHIVGVIGRDGPVVGTGGAIEKTIGETARYLLLKYILPIHNILWDPEDACLTQVYTAVSEQIKAGKVTGKYYQSVARMIEPDPHTKNETLVKDLWIKSEEITGAKWS